MFDNLSQKKKKLVLVAGFLILVAIAAIAFLFFSRLEKKHDAVPDGAGSAPHSVIGTSQGTAKNGNESTERAAIYYNGREYIYNNSLSTLLILGIDDPVLEKTESWRNSSQADMLLLAVFDPARQNCTLIQLNRDTMCEVPVLDSYGKFLRYQVEQLALSHTYGDGMETSCENTVEAVTRFLYGVKIDNYFAFTMDAIPILNDLVGGVTVFVEDDFSDVDPTLVKGTTVRLTAENVEHFVRARQNMTDDPTNINRMNRQAVYLRGLAVEMKEAMAKDESFVMEAYSALSASMVTDCSADDLSSYGERFSGFAVSEILALAGDSKPGEKFMEYYVDESALQQLIIDVFYNPIGDDP